MNTKLSERNRVSTLNKRQIWWTERFKYSLQNRQVK